LVKETEAKQLQSISITYTNPIYENVTSRSESIQPSEERKAARFANRITYYSDTEDVAILLREAMTERMGTLTIHWQQQEQFDEDSLGSWLSEILNIALEITDKSDEGDYLKWHYDEVGVGAEGYLEDGVCYYTITLGITYYTDAVQEAAVDEKVNELIAQLGIEDDTPEYTKLKKIYDYICENISYVDDETLNDETNVIKYTAYGALIDKECVCQGYANLLYRLLKEVGMDVRIISGNANGGPHGWNIVKLGSLYYCVDATWDAERFQNGYDYKYFLLPSFSDHETDTIFLTDDFMVDHPMSKYKYAVDCSHENTITLEAKEATCKDTGLTEGEYCGTCGETIIVQKIIPMVAHSYGAYSITRKATFGKTGEQKAVCTACGKSALKNIPAIKTPVLSAANYTFNNKTKTPSVVVKDTTGKTIAATASYAKGRKSVGKYAVKVTVKSNSYYNGSYTVYFKINPKGVSVSKLSKGKKAFTAKWKKPSSTYRKQMTGYQIRYSTSSKMTGAKTVTIKSTKSTSKTIKKLKAKKYYYVQIRTYKTVKGTKYYSGWSKTKKVKTK